MNETVTNSVTDTAQFSLLTAAIGVSVVFLLLALMSVMMVLIKRLFDQKAVDKKESAPRPATAATAAQPKPPQSAAQSQTDVNWLIAAAAAYLLAADGEQPTAAAWRPAATETNDRWLQQQNLSSRQF